MTETEKQKIKHIKGFQWALGETVENIINNNHSEDSLRELQTQIPGLVQLCEDLLKYRKKKGEK